MTDVQAGSLVTRIQAVDADTGPNSQLLYDIVSGNDDSAFHMDRSTGVVTVGEGGALSRRPARVHRLVVVARDRGTTSLHSVADLTIAVNDSAVPTPLDGEVQRHGARLETTIAIAGGAAVGGALVIGCIVLVAVVVCLLRRRRRSRRRRAEEMKKRHRSR